jgi:hypothetical protein
MVLTLGGLGIWSIIDYILIFFSMFTDRHGVPILRDKKGTQVGIAGFILFGILYGSMYAEFIAEYVEYLANPW